MAEPQVQYAKTSDGVNIAFCTIGEGMPLVLLSLPFNHLEMEWRIPEIRSWYQRLAKKRMVVRYDMRGTGLSQRDVIDFSLKALELDLQAVVDRLGLDRFAMVAPLHIGPMALRYSTDHPDAVSHLILWCSWATSAEYYRSPAVQSLGLLRDQDWETYTETATQALMGFAGGDLARRVADIYRETTTQGQLMAFVREAQEWDAAPLLPQVTAPTLVLHRRHFRLVPIEFARALAAHIPNARLAVMEGELGQPYLGDTKAGLSAIDEFLCEGEAVEAEAKAERLASDVVHTILFTDIEGSTALTDRLGDARARDILREHERITREALATHGGSEVKTMGDGFMASFGSATKALECASAIQTAFAERNESAEEPIKVRIGLNAGEPIAEDDDLFGASVNRAARIAALAKGGEILVANVVRELAEGKGFMFGGRGDTALRDFDDPVRLFEVHWREVGGR